MPLSRDEQRRLDEIERALNRDDPGLAARARMGSFRSPRVMVAGSAAALATMVLIAALIAIHLVPVAAIGVGVLLAIAVFLAIAVAGLHVRRRH